MSNYNGNIEKRKAAQDLMKNKVFLRFVKINFCRSCIGSRKRVIKPLGGYERYHVVASYILVFFIYWNVYRYSICFDWV